MTSLPVFPCGAGALMWEKQEIGVRWVLHVGGTWIPSNYSGHGQSTMFSKIIVYVIFVIKNGDGSTEEYQREVGSVD